jgi:cytoskeleton protein RodZ
MNDELTPDPTPSAAASAPQGVDDAAATPAGPATEPPPHAGPATAGSLIRDARQAQGIDLASLAAMLKIPLRRLEALEADRHDELQGPTFERALAQAACRVLKIDPKPVLALLPQHARNTLEGVTEGINAPFRDGQGGGGLELPAIVRPVGIIVIVLILAAIALFVVPDGWLARVTRPLMNGLAASAPGEGGNGAASAPAAAAVTTPPVPVLVPSAAMPATVAPAATSGALSASPSTVPAPPAASAVPPAVAAPAQAAPATPGVDEVLAHVAPAPNIPLQVVATADSWVEVVDAHGRTLLSRTVVAGESVGLDGAMPMRIKVGNVSGTRLKLRGDNVDLTPWARDNVARLEVK